MKPSVMIKKMSKYIISKDLKGRYVFILGVKEN